MNTPDTPDDAPPDEREFNAEAYFTITAPDEVTAKAALAVAIAAIDAALGHLYVLADFPAGAATVVLSLEDEHGGVEEN